MKKLNMIIVLLVIVIAILGIGILFTSGILQHSDEMKTIALSDSCTINVTASDTNVSLYADTIKLYNDTKNAICIVSYNSQEAFGGNGNALGGAFGFAGIRDSLTVGENLGDLNGFTLYKCDGYYSAKLVNNSTHDNIVITCKDLNLLKKIVSSAKFNKTDVTVDKVNTEDSASTSNADSSNGKTIYGYWDTGEPIYDKETWEKFQKYGKGDWPE